MSLNILSIDVGMKNLAVCLFNVTSNLNYKIECWKVLDLCEDTEYFCKEINKKNKNVCNKKARYFKNDCYYCKMHAKNKNFKMPPQELNIRKVKKLKIKELKILAKKYDIDIDNTFKKEQILNTILNHIDEFYFDNISKIKTKDFNLVQYGRNLKKKFTKIFEKKTIDGVIIENQIGPLALRMKTLQGMIMQHFIERGIPLIEEISATNKLKEFLGNKKTTYTERKKASIKFTQDILNTNNFLTEWIDIFQKHKKKDDLADCFLQGRWYLKNTILNFD